MNSKLQICIPTYNRPRQICESIGLLAEYQKELFFSVLIIDNNSSSDWWSDIELTKDMAIRRNVANIGGQANVMRCIEESDGDYIWIVGDDDHLDKECIATVIDSIKKNPSVDIFNFRCIAPGHLPRRNEYLGSNPIEFFRNIGSLGQIYYVVGYVYKRKRVLPFLRPAYMELGCLAPHVMIALRSVDLSLCVSNAVVHTWEQTSSHSDSLSPIPVLMRVPRLVGLSSSFTEYRLFYGLVRGAKSNFLHPARLLIVALQQSEISPSRLLNFRLAISYLYNSEFKVPTIRGLGVVVLILCVALSPIILGGLMRKLITNLALKKTGVPVYSTSDDRI
jgi:glycosyltransferase involved in cell wall biosynthesis